MYRTRDLKNAQDVRSSKPRQTSVDTNDIAPQRRNAGSVAQQAAARSGIPKQRIEQRRESGTGSIDIRQHVGKRDLFVWIGASTGRPVGDDR